jgi:hypothetical protein
LFEEFLERVAAATPCSSQTSQRTFIAPACHRSMGLAAPANPAVGFRATVTGLDGLLRHGGIVRLHAITTTCLAPSRTQAAAGRARVDGTVLVAAGTSCRHQVDTGSRGGGAPRCCSIAAGGLMDLAWISLRR